MLLSRRSVLLGLGSLAACGFEPVYNSKSNSAFRGRVNLPVSKTPEDFSLRKPLLSEFGEGKNAKYNLRVSYKSSNRVLAIAQNSIDTRFRITGEADFVLVDIQTQEIVLSQNIRRIVGYSANRDRFAADQVRDATELRLAEQIGEEIALRVLLTLEKRNEG